jgi:hypothetical protein
MQSIDKHEAIEQSFEYVLWNDFCDSFSLCLELGENGQTSL